MCSYVIFFFIATRLHCFLCAKWRIFFVRPDKIVIAKIYKPEKCTIVHQKRTTVIANIQVFYYFNYSIVFSLKILYADINYTKYMDYIPHKKYSGQIRNNGSNRSYLFNKYYIIYIFIKNILKNCRKWWLFRFYDY